MKKSILPIVFLVSLFFPVSARAEVYDFFTHTNTRGTIVSTKEYGTLQNTDVAVKNPEAYGTNTYGLATIDLNPMLGQIQNYQISQLDHFSLDINKLVGNFYQDEFNVDGIAIGFVDQNSNYHELRSYFYKFMDNSFTGWATVPNVFDSSNTQAIWWDFTSYSFKTWSQIETEYGQQYISTFILAFDNYYSNYAFDNMTINSDTWSIIDEVIPTPTPEPIITRADILVGKGANGQGIYRAPGLSKTAPNTYFAGGN